MEDVELWCQKSDAPEKAGNKLPSCLFCLDLYLLSRMTKCSTKSMDVRRYNQPKFLTLLLEKYQIYLCLIHPEV